MHQSQYRFVVPTLIFMSLLMVVATSVNAQGVASTTAQERSEERREERAQVREVKQEGRQSALSQLMQNRIQNLVTNTTDRLTAALNRMESIITRLDSRIEKISNEGTDTTAAKEKLAEAEATLEHARDMLSDISPIGEAVASEHPRDAYQEIRTELVAIREEIIKIHRLLQDIIPILKGMGNPNPRQATTTEPVPAQ